MENPIATFNYFEIEVPQWVIDSCPQSGSCDNAIAGFREDDEVAAELNKLDKDKLILELRDYGAWSDEELQDHNENLARILWIAIGNLWEEQNNEDHD